MPSDFKGSPAGALRTRISTAAPSSTIVGAGPAGTSQRVYGLRFTVAGATNISIFDGSVTYELWQFAGPGGIVLDLRDYPYIVILPDQNLAMVNTGSVQVEGMIEYTVAKA